MNGVANRNIYDPLAYTNYRQQHWEWLERDEPLLVKKVPKVDAPLHTKGKFLMFEGFSKRGQLAEAPNKERSK